MSRIALTLAVVCMLALPLTAGQSDAIRFEVVSVRPTQQSNEAVTFVRQNAKGRFVADNITAFTLIQQAYDVFDFQIVGAPGWLNRDRFDIQAIAPSASSVRQDVLLRKSYWKSGSRFGCIVRNATATSLRS